MSYCYDYPRPAVTVDCVVFGIDEADRLKVLLIQRQIPPFQEQWALPGGFVRPQEDLIEAARRELQEETGVDGVFLEQLRSFGSPDRDPRGWVITVAYYALVNLRDYQVKAATDAKEAAWFDVQALPVLGFDHGEILPIAIATLQAKVRQEPIGFELLPTKFTLTQLQRLYEIILGHPLDKRNFRKKLLRMNFVIGLNEKETNVAHRAAQLYQFDAAKYQALKQQGFNFEL
jgi:8-oxo-dGTP diphosphatase